MSDEAKPTLHPKNENLIRLINQTRKHAAEAILSARVNINISHYHIKNGLSADESIEKTYKGLNKYLSCKNILRMLDAMSKNQKG